MKNIFKNKNFIYGSSTSVMVILVIAILLLVNMFVSKFNWSFDLNSDKRFSISQTSVDYLKKINKNITITTFFTQEPEDLKLILNEYTKSNPKIKVEYLDPDKNPAIANKYQDDRSIENSIIVESGNKWRKLSYNDFYQQDYTTGAFLSKVEQKLTGAISYVNEEKESNIYFLTGHGETQANALTSIKTSLQDSSFAIKDLNLFVAASVPEDAEIVAIFNPTKDILADEKTKLDKYLSSGGHLFVTVSPFTKIPNLTDLLKKYNIRINNDYVIENDMSRVKVDIFNRSQFFIPDIQINNITESFASKNLTFIFREGARSLTVLENDIPGLTVDSIAKTSENSWGETNFNDSNPKKDANDFSGPLDIALSAELLINEDTTQKSKVIVFGDSFFITEDLIPYGLGNLDLFMGSIKWLAEKGDLISISPKVITSPTFSPTSSQVLTSLIVSLAIPLIAFITGAVVWARRRHL